MCDESWAVSLADAKRRQAKGVNAALNLAYYMGVAIPFYLAWVMSATLGAVFGPMIGDLHPYGSTWPFRPSFSYSLQAVEGVRRRAAMVRQPCRRSRHPCLRTGRMVCRQWRNFRPRRRLSTDR
ncbi:AzlC family protein [Brucella melitensis]|nr:AzlC family protein [Brucella melitensis]